MRSKGIYQAYRQTQQNIDEEAVEYSVGQNEAALNMPDKNHTGDKKLKKLMFLIFTLAILIFAAQSAFATDFIPSPGSPDSDTEIRLDWSSVPGAQTYVISRYNGSVYVDIATIDVGLVMDPLTYTDTGLQPETTYSYKLTAWPATGPALYLEGMSTEKYCIATTTKIIKPYNLTAVFDINSRAVALNWSCSKLATGSVINSTQSGIATSLPTAATASASIVIGGTDPVQYTISSTGPGPIQSDESDMITVTPLQQPVLTAVSSGGTATITWGSIPQISVFQLERSKWNGTSWDSWVVINPAPTGTGTTDTPPAGGEYRYRLSARPGTGYIGYSSITNPTSGLPAPYNLTLTVVNTGRIDLNWTNGAGNTANIQVQRKVGGGSFTDLGLLTSSATGFSDLISVSNGTTYTYRVRAYISPTSYSAAAEASITPALPAKPGQLYASVTSTTAITLNWTDLSGNELEYRIERLTDPGVFTQIATMPAITASGTGVTYVDNTVQTGKTYIYRVRAWNAMGYSPYSNEATVNAWDAVAPTNLVVTAVSSSRIDLSWSYSGTKSYNTIIERKTGTDGVWTQIYTTAMGTVKYSDTGLTPNTRYFYRVKKSLGTGSAGIPFPSNNIGYDAYTYLDTPLLFGSADTSNRILLSWSGNTSGADIVIERKKSDGSFSPITTVGPSTSSWYDNTGLIPGASYTYRIKAKTALNQSLYSSELTVKNIYLEPPLGLTASVTTGNAITLNWIDNSTDENGFEIWRYVENVSAYTLYATVGKNATTFTDSQVHTGVRYTYQVRAYVAAGSLYSPFSNTASVGIGMINPPTNLTYEYVSSTEVMLRWTDTSDNESGFKVEWKKEADGEWSVYSWMSTNAQACQVTGLNQYIRYYFRVRAYSYTTSADSVSDEILVSTALPAAPSDVKAVSLTASQARITWKDNSDSEQGFKVLCKPSYALYYTTIATLPKDSTSYVDSRVTSGNLYYYKVVSYNGTGTSESPETSVRINSKASFSDLGSVSWAKEAIENLAGLGIITGVGGNRFNPNGTITKAEFTSIVVKTFNFDTSIVGSLADVKSNKWYYRSVMVAENLGLISGDSKNKFYPETPIKREEIAVILFKALEASGKDFALHDNSVLEKFTDKNRISSDAVASVASLVGEGIIGGISDKAIGPQNTATRAQAAVFIYKTLGKIADQ